MHSFQSVNQALVIEGVTIDPALLKHEPIRPCASGSCRGACCGGGVWLSRGQAAEITANASLIAPEMEAGRADPAGWFAHIEAVDPQFPPAQFLATVSHPDPRHPSGRSCVFWRAADGFCAIQVASQANRLSPWGLKPLHCSLYPLSLEAHGEDQRLFWDRDNAVFSAGHCCSVPCAAAAAEPVFQIYAAETALALGLEGYRKLCVATGQTPKL